MPLMKQRRFTIPDYADAEAQRLADNLGVPKETVFRALVLWGLDTLPEATITGAVEDAKGYPRGSLQGRRVWNSG